MRLRRLAALISVTPAVFFTTSAASAQGLSLADRIADQQAIARIVQQPSRDLCDRANLLPGFARCFAKAVTDTHGVIKRFTAPMGFGPTDLASAYKLPTSGGNGRLVAIVDANDYANAEADLGQYRMAYGLSPCTTMNGCFKRVDQNGGTSYPSGDSCSGWNGEAALDLDMVSAACPDCHIVLIETSSANTNDLATGVATGIKLGAFAVSNSYGGNEDMTAAQEDSAYTSTSAWITASSGDNGYGASFPATGSHVVAVGGTSLATSSSSRGWAETAWSSGGSGCSGFISKPGWQNDMGCKERMEADVAAVGDPSTGVAVYCDSWQTVGGTSASAPYVAAVFTLLNIAPDPSMPWKTSGSAFFDVTSGSNGSCTTNYFCNAGMGYDGPTGWGTPNGALLAMMGGGGGSSGGGSSSSGSSSGGSGSSSGGSSSGSSGSSSGASSSGASGSSGSGGGSGGSSSGASSGGGSSSSGGDGSSSGASGSGGGASTGSSGGSSGGNSNNPGSANWPNNSAGGCGCSVVNGGQDLGGLAVGLGLVLAFGTRRRKSRD